MPACGHFAKAFSISARNSGGHRVVGGGDVNELGGCEVEAPIQRGVKSFAWDLVKMKTRIALGDGLKKFPAAIAGSAVENDRFPAGERLFKQGLNALVQKFPLVERRQQN